MPTFWNKKNLFSHETRLYFVYNHIFKDGFRTSATFKMELFTTIVNGRVYKKWINSTKCSKFIFDKLAKVSKIYFCINFLFWYYKNWKISIYQPGKSREVFWITEISDYLIQGFFFVIMIFVCIFFIDINFDIFSVDFLSVKFEYISWNYWNLNPDFNSLLGKTFL